MTQGARKLSTSHLKPAMTAISAWQRDPQAPVPCPLCGKPALAIADRSARPFTAWFALRCSACGLEDTVTYPLGGSGSTWS